MQTEDHNEMKALLEENLKLSRENQKILKKLHRASVIGIVMTVVWYTLLIGLPFALYFYVLGPYFEAFGSSFEQFQEGIGELPGLKSLDNIIGNEK